MRTAFPALTAISGLALSIWRGELGAWTLAALASAYSAAVIYGITLYGGRWIDGMFLKYSGRRYD